MNHIKKNIYKEWYQTVFGLQKNSKRAVTW